MASVNAVYDEVDRLRGLLSAVRVNYPDTRIRLDSTCALLDQLLTKPLPGLLQEVIADLIELRNYFADLVKRLPELAHPFQPVIELIDHLLGSEVA